MKKLLSAIALLFLLSGIAFAQTTVDLNGVTFGFGAGPAYSFDRTYDYSLTTDAAHNLKLQPLNKGAFVISSVLMVKLGKVSTDPTNETLVKQAKKSDYESLASTKATKEAATADFYDRLSINLAIDLANVSSNVSFNKNVSGGIGLGYFITNNLQLAVFYDISQVRQLRDYVVSSYQDKPIPNSDGKNYNALDTSDNNLFYNKTISGLSFKLVFSIANKKSK